MQYIPKEVGLQQEDMVLNRTYEFPKDVRVEIYGKEQLSPAEISDLNFCFELFRKVSKKYTFKLFLTSRKKELPTAASKPLTPANVNSGFTIPNENLVVIFRKEEWEKVLIHECIHAFQLDFQEDSENQNLALPPAMRFLKDPRINESFTEFWAETIWFQRKNIILKTQIQFALRQCAKICRHFGIQSVQDFFDMKKMLLDKWKESDTTVFSYFFVRTFLLMHSNEIKSNFPLFGRGQSFNDFCVFLNRNFVQVSDVFWQSLQRLLQHNESHVNSSLRMTGGGSSREKTKRQKKRRSLKWRQTLRNRQYRARLYRGSLRF